MNKTKTKVKIAMCVHYWLTSKGGIVSFVRNLVEALNGQELWDIIIVTSDKHNTNGGSVKRDGLIKIFMPLQVFCALLKTKPDIIHVHEHFWLLFGAVVYKFFHKTRLVFTLHTQLLSFL